MKLLVPLLFSAPLLANAFGPPLGYDGGPAAPEKQAVDPFLLHACLMVIAVCLFLFPGMLMARFFKKIFEKWFYVHAAFQTIGILMIFSGFISVLAGKGGEFTVGFHQAFGLVAFILFMLEYIFGILAHFKFDPSRLAPPIFPDKVHWFVGRFVVFWSFTVIGFGLNIWAAGAGAWVLYIIWAVAAVALFLTYELKIGQVHESSSSSSGNSYDYQRAYDNGEPRKGGLADKFSLGKYATKWDASSSAPTYLYFGFMFLTVCLIPVGLVCKLVGL